ncbi:MAG: glutamine-hydrolyzing GMP synthase, partial [Firmicutes bacterium]|nr:glutamine-hydrolyzing GMP synthase [Bacillota bacterium]
LVCVHVDHGLMRLNETEEIKKQFADTNVELIVLNESDRFLWKLENVTDPEKKRKIIGKEFINVFKEQAAKLKQCKFLAQGTIYPDIVESGSKNSKVIKSHHNVGGLPENLSFEKLVEPLSGLYKNEVRELGKLLNLPDYLTKRQPFPGPGLAVRVIGEVTKAKLDVLRKADAIFREEIDKLKIRPSQYFAIHTGVNSVGIKNETRVFESVIALRAVETPDFMKAEYCRIPFEILTIAGERIVNEIEEVSRVVYDITDKPPATVEWE